MFGTQRAFQVNRNIMGFNPPTGKHPRGDPLNKYFLASRIAKLVHAAYEKVRVVTEPESIFQGSQPIAGD